MWANYKKLTDCHLDENPINYIFITADNKYSNVTMCDLMLLFILLGQRMIRECGGFTDRICMYNQCHDGYAEDGSQCKKCMPCRSGEKKVPGCLVQKALPQEHACFNDGSPNVAALHTNTTGTVKPAQEDTYSMNTPIP